MNLETTYQNSRSLAKEYLALDIKDKQDFLAEVFSEMEIPYVLEDINNALKIIHKEWFCFDVIDKRK
ncbi:hypothetical protein [Helicobacter cappadocius]|uniref:Uncharacterized protein n=1 Tax=Helicobacter cappadocius TaxID=3063998 RepID=A0AA90T9F4_9HELI|nr:MULTISPECIES: hypothetical protein [unclassified Helicobacter]MDO7253067.1 hypothetical protein [Helicobacter sp. faydin-H75]MDP2538807.1 hypothetical protein [Helicobacter sp. faydin-H76]